MSTGILLALLTPQAALSIAAREQCWPQGSVSTNAPQNAAAIRVLRSWGAAFDALQGQDVCQMATRTVAQAGVPDGATDGCWPVQCVQVGQELVVQAFSLTTDTVRPGASVGAAAAGAADAVKHWVASLAVAPAATGAIPDSLSQQNFPHLTHIFADGHKLSGVLPSALLNNKNLQQLKLLGNKFSGSLPTRMALQPSARRGLMAMSDYFSPADQLQWTGSVPGSNPASPTGGDTVLDANYQFNVPAANHAQGEFDQALEEYWKRFAVETAVDLQKCSVKKAVANGYNERVDQRVRPNDRFPFNSEANPYPQGLADGRRLSHKLWSVGSVNEPMLPPPPPPPASTSTGISNCDQHPTLVLKMLKTANNSIFNASSPVDMSHVPYDPMSPGSLDYYNGWHGVVTLDGFNTSACNAYNMVCQYKQCQHVTSGCKDQSSVTSTSGKSTDATRCRDG
jgi:hypothetical protein